jgi:hypothetical protein
VTADAGLVPFADVLLDTVGDLLMDGPTLG